MRDNHHAIYLSVVIPVFNEQKRVLKGLQTTLNYLNKQKYTWEIVLVDDGSTDDTFALAQKLLKKVSSKQIIRHQVNLGKGAAIRTGILAAKGKYIIFSDIDLSTPITELPKLLRSLRDSEVAIGVRRHPKSQVVKHQPFFREFLGHIFTKLTNWLVTPGIYDVTCGFKGFQRQVAKKIFSQTKINRWAFDAEVLYLARKNGFKIAQVPVIWADNSATKVHIFSDGIKAFLDLVKLKASRYFIY